VHATPVLETYKEQN